MKVKRGHIKLVRSIELFRRIGSFNWVAGLIFRHDARRIGDAERTSLAINATVVFRLLLLLTGSFLTLNPGRGITPREK
jgi:hypothetical protein